MKFRALATDYDGTLAWHGAVPDSTCEALDRLKASGRKLLLVTGRELHDLFSVFQYAKLFDLMVMENGGCFITPKRKIPRFSRLQCRNRSWIALGRKAFGRSRLGTPSSRPNKATRV